jgi:MFS transporter, DHA2 family, multidrug resistance protein
MEVQKMTANASGEPTAGAREWIGLAVLALPTLLVSIDVSVIILALPHIGVSLGASSTELLWIMDVYGFLLAGFMVTMGTLGDRIGRRKLLMIGGAGFALASVMAAFSPSAELLILSRGLLGIAGATLSPSMLALISNMFRNEAQRGFAISVWLTCFMGGMVLGPLVGGIMLEHFWWGSVFLLGVPVMVLLLATAPFLVPEYKAPTGHSIDLLSVGLSLATILPIIYGLKEIAREGVQPLFLVSIAAGLGFGIVFATRQRRLADPLLDLKLFRNPTFSSAVAGMFLITLTGAMMLYFNQYLQLVRGLSPLATGLWTIPGVLGSVAGFMLAPIIARWVRPALLIGGGLILAVIGVGAVATFDESTSLVLLAVAFAIWNLGCAPMVTLSSGIVLSAVPPEKAGSGAAIQETFAEFGFSMGIAALGSLGTAIYRAGVDGAVPASLPADLEAQAADTLAGALAAAEALPADAAAALIETAREAFLSGMHVTAMLAGLVLLAIAVLALAMFRGVPPLGSAPAALEPAAAGGQAPAQ